METMRKADFEMSRLKELYNLNILDTDREERFDRFTRLIADIFNAPIALVSLVDSKRQWFKSFYGISVKETPRELSFCAHAILEKEILVIPDTTKDPRFSENPLVLEEPKIRFYAGAILKGPTGMPLGTVCIVDRKTRNFSNREQNQLIQFSQLIEREILFDTYVADICSKSEEALFEILKQMILKK